MQEIFAILESRSKRAIFGADADAIVVIVRIAVGVAHLVIRDFEVFDFLAEAAVVYVVVICLPVTKEGGKESHA